MFSENRYNFCLLEHFYLFFSHIEYEKDDKKFMRMKFYVEGSRKKGTVHLEMKQVIPILLNYDKFHEFLSFPY